MTGRAFDPGRWQRLTELFDRAVELDGMKRGRLLDSIAEADLRADLLNLLDADAAAGPLDTQAGAVARRHLEQALSANAGEDTDWVGQRIGPWRIEQLLASGGMGRVFLVARDDGQFEQHAALKLLGTRWIDDLARRRFLEERRVLAKLAHPNIARLLDGGLGAQGEPWYAMEYVDGSALTDWCDARELPVPARLDLFRKICEAVDFAHRHLVIHRDLKPGNILVNAEGEPKLLDFGIAKLLPAADAQTRSETRMMTPEYAAPEQLRGDAVSTATDVYALGAILFELLTGQRAFPDPLATREPPSVLRACPSTGPHASVRARSRATTPTHLRKLLRGDLERILRHALDPDPARRYRNAAALSADLHRHLRGHAISLRRDRVYRFGKFVLRYRTAVAAIGLAFLASLGSTVYSVRQARLASAQASRAAAARDFVVGVFEQTDPDARRGKSITAHELLDMGQRQLQNEPDLRPFRTEMQGLIGHLYWLVGDYPKAQSLMHSAVVSPAASTPPDVLARNLLYLAQSELEKELFDAARKHAAQAFALSLQAGDAGAATASDARRLDADALTGDGNAIAAAPILRRALKDDTTRFGVGSTAVADDLTMLAWTTRELSHYQESITWSKRAIPAEAALHGRASSQVLANLETLSSTEGHIGDLTPAVRTQLKAVALATQLYGPAHRETIAASNDLYFLYYRQEHYARALAGHLALLKLIQPIARDRPEQLAYEWNYIAIDYMQLARFDESLRAERQSLAVWAGIRSSDSGYASNDSRTNLANILMLMGRFKEAEATYKEVIRVEREHGASDSEWLNRDLGELGTVYRMQHRYPEAIAITAMALRHLPPTAGPIPVRGYLQSSLALAQLEAGDINSAELSAAQAMRIGRVAYKDTPLSFSALQYTSARVAMARNRAADAESSLRAASSTRASLARNDPRFVEVQVALIHALEMEGKLAEAKSLRAQVEPVLTASESPYFADLRRQLITH